MIILDKCRSPVSKGRPPCYFHPVFSIFYQDMLSSFHACSYIVSEAPVFTLFTRDFIVFLVFFIGSSPTDGSPGPNTHKVPVASPLKIPVVLCTTGMFIGQATGGTVFCTPCGDDEWSVQNVNARRRHVGKFAPSNCSRGVHKTEVSPDGLGYLWGVKEHCILHLGNCTFT